MSREERRRIEKVRAEIAVEVAPPEADSAPRRGRGRLRVPRQSGCQRTDVARPPRGTHAARPTVAPPDLLIGVL